MGALRLRQQDVPEADYMAMLKKDAITTIIGPLIRSVNFTTRKLKDNPAGVKWTFECPRRLLPELLKCSGYQEATLSIGKEEEARLGALPVFATAQSAHHDWQLIEKLEHFGVSGPTRSGHYVVRATKESIADIRQACLTSTSSYANVWHLIINYRFTGRFPACHSMETVASSLRSSLAKNRLASAIGR